MARYISTDKRNNANTASIATKKLADSCSLKLSKSVYAKPISGAAAERK